MLEGKFVDLTSRRYILSPGDGSRYDFSLVDLEGVEGVKGVVRGVGNGEGFVGLIIHDPTHQGAHEVRKASLRTIHPPFIGYLLEKMGYDESYRYAITAIALAARVLVDFPSSLDQAASSMLEAPLYLP